MFAVISLILTSLYIVAISIVSTRMIIATKRAKVNKRESYERETFHDEKYYEKYTEEDRFKYYDYLRDEIKREDEITHQRLTWTITFHAFLLNAFGILLVFGNWTDVPIDILRSRRLAIVAIGLIGLTFGFTSLMGILASRRSIDDTKERWIALNKVWGDFYPKKVPQAFGQNKAFSWGRMYAVVIPIGLIVLWAVLSLGHLAIYITSR